MSGAALLALMSGLGFGTGFASQKMKTHLKNKRQIHNVLLSLASNQAAQGNYQFLEDKEIRSFFKKAGFNDEELDHFAKMGQVRKQIEQQGLQQQIQGAQTGDINAMLGVEEPKKALPAPSVRTPSERVRRGAVTSSTPATPSPTAPSGRPMKISRVAPGSSTPVTITPDEEKMLATFGTKMQETMKNLMAEDPNLPPQMAQRNAAIAVASQMKWAPKEFLELLDLDDNERQGASAWLTSHYVANKGFRQQVMKITNLKGEALSRMIYVAAARKAAHVTGHLPSWAVPQEAKISPEVEEVLTAYNLLPTPENVQVARKHLKGEEQIQAGAVAEEKGLGTERAKARAFEGDYGKKTLDALPSGQEMLKQEEVTKLEARREEGFKDIIPTQLASEYGVPFGTTYQGLVDKKLIPLTKDVKDIKAQTLNAIKVVDELADLSKHIHVDDTQGFFLTGLKMHGEAFLRTNADAALYKRFRNGFLSVIARLYEKGVLTEGDVGRVKNLLPGIIEKKSVAERNWKVLRELLNERIKTAETAVEPLTDEEVSETEQYLLDNLVIE